MYLWVLENARNPTGLSAGTDYVQGTASGTGTTASITVTTKAAGSWLVGSGGTWGSTITAGANTTLPYQSADGQWGGCRTDNPLTAGSYTMTGTLTSDEWNWTALEVLRQ